MSKRKAIPKDVETEVLRLSRRRCCLCYGLKGDTSDKNGQIARLDEDPSNNDPDNLVWLCLDHHDAYDSRHSQSKGLTEREVRRYPLGWRIQQEKACPRVAGKRPFRCSLAR